MARTLALPLVVRSGALGYLEQGAATEIAQSVALLLATRPGERRSVPTYGLPDPLFGHDVDVDQVADVIDEWEDRADAVTVRQTIDALDPDTRTVDVGLGATPATTTGAP